MYYDTIITRRDSRYYSISIMTCQYLRAALCVAVISQKLTVAGEPCSLKIRHKGGNMPTATGDGLSVRVSYEIFETLVLIIR